MGGVPLIWAFPRLCAAPAAPPLMFAESPPVREMLMVSAVLLTLLGLAPADPLPSVRPMSPMDPIRTN